MAKTNSKSETNSKNFSHLHRSTTNKVLAGVAGGLGEYFNIDPTIIRIIFILLTVFSGSGILIYLVLWLIIPTSTQPNNLSNSDQLRQNADEITDRAKNFLNEMSFRGPNQEESRFWWGLILLIFGFLALFHNFGLFEIFSLGKLWPIALVVLGIMILNRKKNI